jgi:hypothetical protein
MPLSPAVDREPIHHREITLRGYRRADGLFDIEAELGDTKSYAFTTEERGQINPGERIHGMSMRLTVDENYLIVGCEADMRDTPYGICPTAAPNFARLAGLSIGRGFIKAANERIGGTEGCTHLRELLAQMATVAFQTIAPLKMKIDGESIVSTVLNTCLAHAADGSLVKRRWPALYTGPADPG